MVKKSINDLPLPNCVSVFFFYNVTTSTLRIDSPGAHAVFPVGGAWTHLEGCTMQSLLSENVYKNELSPMKILLYPRMHDMN